MSGERHLEELSVLLVDDDTDCREFLALALEQHGIKVAQAVDAEQGIEILKKNQFDCVTTDKNLPGMDGVSLIRYIRENHGDIPVILITGQGSIGSAVDAFKFGAQDYLLKPLEDGEELIEAIWRAVDHFRLSVQHKLLQEKFVRAQRMESLGILAGGMAHDLNNLMCPVVALTSVMNKQVQQLAAGEKSKLDMLIEEIRQIEDVAQRAATLVQDVLTASVGGKFERKLQDVNQVVKYFMKSSELINMRLTRPDVIVESRLSADLFPVAGSDVHLIRAISNVVRNGFEAIDARRQSISSQGGSLSGEDSIVIKSSAVHLSEAVMGYEMIQPGDYVLLEIADSGIGIDSNKIQRIFEPFFSTKDLSSTSGNGLGLAIVRGIVRDQNGFVDVETEPGKGTNIKLYLPAAEKAAIAAETGASAMGKMESVLVVDDESGSRFVARRLLKMLGYTVTEAASGLEAIKLIEEGRRNGKDKPFELVMLDMMHDDKFDGLETYREITKLCPGQKALLVTGYTATDRANQMIALGASCLPKPYGLKDLSAAIRQELDKK